MSGFFHSVLCLISSNEKKSYYCNARLSNSINVSSLSCHGYIFSCLAICNCQNVSMRSQFTSTGWCVCVCVCVSLFLNEWSLWTNSTLTSSLPQRHRPYSTSSKIFEKEKWYRLNNNARKRETAFTWLGTFLTLFLLLPALVLKASGSFCLGPESCCAGLVDWRDLAAPVGSAFSSSSSSWGSLSCFIFLIFLTHFFKIPFQ